jgi:imidazoleglycerol-phosphate dehydratase
MMNRTGEVKRKTRETDVRISLNLDGTGRADIDSGIPFLDHMLTLFAVHGFFDLSVNAAGDLDVDLHHTVEDVGLVLGDAVSQALDKRQGIRRYGHAVIPMDDALAAVTVDLSNRPFLVCNMPESIVYGTALDPSLTREFFRALASRGGMNLHINVAYGQNDHHVIESIFKAFGRALDQAVAGEARTAGVPSSKGAL